MSEDKVLSGGGFPVAVVGVNARDVGGVVTSPNNYAFGVNRDRMVDVLRAFADAIEKKGVILPQEMEFSSSAKIDDFVMFKMTLTYAVPVKSDV